MAAKEQPAATSPEQFDLCALEPVVDLATITVVRFAVAEAATTEVDNIRAVALTTTLELIREARHVDCSGCGLARDPCSDLFPELALHLSAQRRRPRRLHRRTPRQLLHPSSWSAHQHLHHQGVATTS